MSSIRSGRVSRKNGIPHGFVWKLQSPRPNGPKPLTRRPTTACKTCRAAKARCDGLPECGRCTARGLACTYAPTGTQTADTTTSQEQHHNLSADAILATSAPSLHLPFVDSLHSVTSDEGLYPQLPNTMSERSDDTTSWTLNGFDWANIGPQLHGEFPGERNEPLAHTWRTQEHGFDYSLQPLQGDADVFQNGPEATSQELTQVTPSDSVLLGELATPSEAVHRLLSASLPSLTSNCRCREDLASLLPQIDTVLQKKQLDGIHKTTVRVMQKCESVIGCMDCKIACTDLIATMAVLQRTGVCFEYISKASLDGAIRMDFGGMDVPIGDARLRAMLVLNLTSRANDVLDAISDKAQSMLRGYGCNPPSAAQTNVGYLDTVIREFREVLSSTATFTI
ncbi:hypothetical protein K491DRAFT_325647 [Lophiostoma macrostomum CBS 122681]|uniref:Zn(2)-C6 fungal-type domain-containing protein n=1 Tax=Lophiostoma macrostomum CBS 122681 TaxID=1314788 RepID=A0A6A6SHE6_9PLEO|nr:hypothetical protein K491DRAFT_325647 [Lophiostoma macrostomum CBS 122681]